MENQLHNLELSLIPEEQIVDQNARIDSKKKTFDRIVESEKYEYFDEALQRLLIQWRMKESPGEFHCIDGPAIVYGDQEQYFVFGTKFSKEEFEELAFRLPVGAEYIVNNGQNFTICRLGDEVYVDSKGVTHRVDGPAIQYSNGTKSWYRHGRRHRTDGPALMFDSTSLKDQWWVDGQPLTEEEFNMQMNESVRTEHENCVEWRNKEGQLHRTDGPAREWVDDPAQWYLNGKQLTEEEFNKVVDEKKSSLVQSITKGLLTCLFWATITSSTDHLKQLQTLKEELEESEEEQFVTPIQQQESLSA